MLVYFELVLLCQRHFSFIPTFIQLAMMVKNLEKLGYTNLSPQGRTFIFVYGDTAVD